MFASDTTVIVCVLLMLSHCDPCACTGTLFSMSSMLNRRIPGEEGPHCTMHSCHALQAAFVVAAQLPVLHLLLVCLLATSHDCQSGWHDNIMQFPMGVCGAHAGSTRQETVPVCQWCICTSLVHLHLCLQASSTRRPRPSRARCWPSAWTALPLSSARCWAVHHSLCTSSLPQASARAGAQVGDRTSLRISFVGLCQMLGRLVKHGLCLP